MTKLRENESSDPASRVESSGHQHHGPAAADELGNEAKQRSAKA